MAARIFSPAKTSIVTSGALFAILLIAVGIAAWPHRDIPGVKLKTKLADLFSFEGEVPGWTSKRHPVAETEEMKRAVAEVLNYDEAVYTVHESTGGVRISFYAAYWKPGKMSHRLVAGHTPDVCWVGGGWVRVKAKSLELRVEGGAKPVAESLALRVESRNSLSVEYREFQRDGQTEYVVFGHLVGGRSMSYGTGGPPPWHGFISDLWARGFRQREEQLFVRISSNRPFEEFKSTPPVQHFLRRLFAEWSRIP